MTPAHLEIRLLGELTVLRDGDRIQPPPSRKARALLGYLVATGQPQLRERLCDLLWDGPSDPRAELRWSLSRLRPLVNDAGTVRLHADHERVWFDPGGARIDLASLHDVLGPDPARATLEVLEAAAAEFRGELLEGLDLPDCYRYHAWCAAERERVRALQAVVLGSLVERLTGRPEEALRYARAWVAADPFSQPAHAHVIRLLHELGRTREALAHYDGCRRMLARELGAQPVEIEAARRAIRRQAPPSAAAPEPAPAAPRSAPAGAAAEASGPDAPPLAARRAERAVLEDAVASLEPDGVPPVLLLSGEPGIGKTRLLEELAALARGGGARVLAGRGYESEMVRPYGAWVDALRALPDDLIPETLQPALAPLLPRFGLGSASDRNEIFEALVRLLTHLGSSGPVVMVLDDLQWLDDASAALFHFASRASRGVLFATAARPAELQENAGAWSVVRTLRREGRLRSLEIGPLDNDGTAELVRSVAPDTDLARILADSGGNPLFALEEARALARGAPASETLGSLIDDRLARLGPAAGTAVPWAAALGRSFELELLQAVTELPSGELLGAVDELERHGILRPAATGAYDFGHDLIRRAAYRRLSGPRRRLAHRRVAQVIGGLEDPDGGLAADLAHHATLAGDSDTAARACLVAGERCLRIFARQEAAELARRGLEHAAQLALPARVERQAGLLKLLVHAGGTLGRERHLETEITRVVRAAEDTGLPAAMNVALQALSYLHWRHGDFATAQSHTLRAAEAGRAADPGTTAHALADTARCLAHLERDLPRAEALVAEAVGLADRLGIRLVDVPWALGLLRHHDGEYAQATAHLLAALDLARAEQHRWAECDCLTRLTMIDLETGRAAAARDRCAELAPVAERMGEGSELPFATALDAAARYALGEKDAAPRLEAALATLRTIDSNLLLGYVLIAAAEVELAAGGLEAAATRGREAGEAAERAGGRSLAVLADALLARCALAAGGRDDAARHLDALREALAAGTTLSARAHAAAAAILDALDSTPIPTPTPPPPA